MTSQIVISKNGNTSSLTWENLMEIKPARKVRSRIRKGIAHYEPLLKQAHERNIGESDTANIVNDMLTDIFGYEKLFDITTEFKIRGRFADFLVRLDQVPRLIVEVKSIGTGLKEEHVRQAVDYAATQGIDWVALTNAIEWQIYHMKFTKPIDWDLVCSFDLLEEAVPLGERICLTYLLCKESMSKSEIASYWQEKVALSPTNIASILLTDSVIERLRIEIKAHTGYFLEKDDLRSRLVTQLFRTSFGSVEPAPGKAGRRIRLKTKPGVKRKSRTRKGEGKKAA